MIGAYIAKFLVRRAFASANSHDLDKFIAAWRDDCTFIYPGDIPASGTHEGKAAAEKWFKKFFEQFPVINFQIKNVCVDNLFDFTGTNTVAVHWYIDSKNKKGLEGHNCGFTLIKTKFGKAYFVQDFIFDTGPEFRKVWGAK